MKIETVVNLAQTVYAIARSPAVSEYMIGVTSRPNISRRTEYHAKHGYQHLVILADNLTPSIAERVEEALQGYIQHAPNLAVFKKYERSRRRGPYYRNLGRRDTLFSVYMAWRDDT
ncbi:hypothetical protein MOV76_34240 [Rhizobium sp. PRIMUS64]|uniref:hypothetical protein n=1 Tax=Rhizobium sp. PRIMUS64 TaxID=2908925 RepID=UPI001FF5761A|nr:hypothetical protein [Rhizobium sp. PRIMUS64]MCJ9696626.1 hypothetical protein [Rhizobium sp. PRIMUS64]